MFKKILSLMTLTMLLASATGQAETMVQSSTEQRFQDVFMTAGYTTALGAALGAAALSFSGQPDEHLRYVALGASLGFIGGASYGAYNSFSYRSSETQRSSHLYAATPRFMVHPLINLHSLKIDGLAGQFTLAHF